MAFSESVFSFEMLVEELNSYVPCKEFYIASKFADVFTLNLKDPNYADPFQPQVKKSKRIMVRNAKLLQQKTPLQGKQQQPGQSVLFTSRIDTLMLDMKNYPIELTLYDKDDPTKKIGSTHVPWSPIFIDYLYKVIAKAEAPPAYISSRYNVYDEFTAERVVTLRLNSKLTRLPDSQIVMTSRSISRENHNSNISYGVDTTIPRKFKEPETGTIKTSYNVEKRNKIKNWASKKSKIKKEKKTKQPIAIKEVNNFDPPIDIKEVNLDEKHLYNTSIISFIKSDTRLDRKREFESIDFIKTNSCSSINGRQINILNYIFGDLKGPVRNQVLCVGYFTVENDLKKSDTSSTKETSKPGSSEKSSSKERYKFDLCEKDCPGRKNVSGYADSVCSLDLPKEAADLVTVKKCKIIKCDNKTHRKDRPPPDNGIQLDFSNYNKNCCNIKDTVKEEVVGGMKAKMKFEKDCFCTCECTFGFFKHTTYCGVCGGYEEIGDDVPNMHIAPACPIFHKVDKKKPSTPSEKSYKNKCDEVLPKTMKSNKPPTGKSLPSGKSGATTTEAEKIAKKKTRKEKKDQKPYGDKFKFNYGYSGIPPHIGHSQCKMPCSGRLDGVPKDMGWLWTADDIPGLKFRPDWKPGAAHKHVVRLLKMAEHPGVILAKKKRKDTGPKKKPLKRPLLTVAKKDGEYTVTLETMKMYPKQRAINQHPYEDKPLVTYTIGRTEEENRERRKKKEREKRRLERDQRAFIQSAFSDMCQEICLKTYQQALGILPEAEIPDCPCYPILPGPEVTDLDHSCSCSEDPDIGICSDTDSDEWIIEVTPPNATFDPSYKWKKVFKSDNTTQYTYLDFRVKLLDRSGNQVPRFFKGPDGKTQCSDLGGFWSPKKKWLEINVDGFIGADGRWAPMIFTGPNGELIECEAGKFQIANGTWLVVGVDGYVDETETWKYYTERKEKTGTAKKRRNKKVVEDKGKESPYKPSEATWSCFGDANPKDLSEMGILGHGTDKKLLLKTLQEMLSHGEDVKIPGPSMVPCHAPKKGKGKRKPRERFEGYDSRSFFLDRQRCKHFVPSEKGIVAVDGHGNKTYFKLKDYKNRRPDERITSLSHQRISLSSFHVPCFSSFINSEIMKQQLYERRVNMNPNSDTYSDQHDREYGTHSNGKGVPTGKQVFKNIIV